MNIDKIIFSILLGVLLSFHFIQAQPVGIRCGTRLMNAPLSYADSTANRGQADLKMFVENFYNAYKIFKWGTKNQSRCVIHSILVDDGNRVNSYSIDSLSSLNITKIISVEIMIDDAVTNALYGTIGAECGVVRLKVERKESE